MLKGWEYVNAVLALAAKAERQYRKDSDFDARVQEVYDHAPHMNESVDEARSLARYLTDAAYYRVEDMPVLDESELPMIYRSRPRKVQD